MRLPPPSIASRRAAAPAALALAIGLSGPAAAASPDPLAEPVWAARAGASFQPGLQPPGFTAARDRGALELELTWRPASRAWVRGRLDALRWDRGPGDARNLGPGDLRLATGVQAGPDPWRGELLVELKLPNAADERQLGTDETDLAFLLGLLAHPDPIRLDLHVGVDLRGDPRRSMRQDPVGLLQAVAAHPLGPLLPRLGLAAELPLDREAAARQPPRTVFALGLEGPCPFLWGGEALVGTSAAGPDLGGRLWLGLGAGCGGPGALGDPPSAAPD